MLGNQQLVKFQGLMKKILWLLVVGYWVLSVLGVRALEGVGALVNEVSSGEAISVVGKHAPGAQIVVVVGDEVVVSALDEGSGDFSFKFQVEGSKVGGLEIFGIDLAGVTERVAVPVSGFGSLLLPPTIVENPEVDLGSNGMGIGGYSYPGAVVTVSLSGDNGFARTDVVVTKGDGGWTLDYDGLDVGHYEAVAGARFGEDLSQQSQVFAFDVLTPLDRAVEDVGEAVARVVDVFIPEVVTQAAEQVAEQAEVVTQAVAPVVGAGLVAQLVLVGRGLLYWLAQAGIAMMQFFGFWKKRHPWGVVYDAVTKSPMQWAIVRLYSVGLTGSFGQVGQAGKQELLGDQQMKLVGTDVTGKAGVFSFFPKAGAYVIKVARGGYRFPSKLVIGRRDGEYARVYHGEKVRFEGEGSLVELSVPMDPLKAVVGLKFRLLGFLRRRVGTLTLLSLVIGLVMSLIAVAGGKGGVNGLLLVFYSLMLLMQVYLVNRRRKLWGVVRDERGQGVSGVTLDLLDSRFDRLVQRRVTDATGKYQFVVPAGEYVIKVTSVGYNLVRGVRKTYQGQVIVVEGVKPKLIVLSLVVSGGVSECRVRPLKHGFD